MIDLEQIRSWANEAVTLAAENAGVTLDYSRSSIGNLEKALDKLREQGRDDDATWDLACRFGAYLGEVMRKDFEEFGYSWDEDYDGEPILVSSQSIGNATLGKVLPITKCNKYLLSGQSESVAKLYASCISMLKGGDMAESLSSLGIDASKASAFEPSYLLNGRFNANAAAWLLYGDYVFFQQNEIVWDGTIHSMKGMQVNAAKVNEIPTLVSNISVLQGMLEFLTELEKDEGLRVPLNMIHPGVQNAIRNEDLTGITLFNLMAQAQALMIKEPESDHYAVVCDVRLPAGIPAFYQLVARMIWDMRAYNERSGAFEVVFANARNLDADVVLGEVDRMVPGAVSNAIWKVQVYELPQVELPSAEEARAFAQEASRVFASGFDDPADIQADEQLFETALNQLAKEFPITQDIEGTGYLNRVEHIEHVQVGDPLVLAADWENQWFDPVCIEVFNAAGETLGNLSNRFSITLSGHRELACLLPHITATVETVTPKSKRRKNAKYALMDVRMELDPTVLGRDGNLIPEAITEAKALLELPVGERVVLSKGDVVASQLKGNIDVSKAHDVPNPIGGTFRAQGGGEQKAGASSKRSKKAKVSSKAETVPKKQEPSVPHTGRWTFEKHQLAQGRRFMVEIPDQWYPVDDSNWRPIARLTGDDGDEGPQIICSTMVGDLDAESVELFRNHYIPEARVQMFRKSLYENDLANTLTRVVEDWLVEGKNCQVLVFEVRHSNVFSGDASDNYEYTVQPVVYDHADFLRIADSWDHLDKGELKELAFSIAASVELDRPVELKQPAQLDEFCKKPADADEFCKCIIVISKLLDMSRNDRMNGNAWKAIRQADNDKSVLLTSLRRIQAEGFNESIVEATAYYERFVNALEKQAQLGVPGLDKMLDIVKQFSDAFIVDHVTYDEDKEVEREINSLGIITIPESYYPLRERYDALKPGATSSKIEHKANKASAPAPKPAPEKEKPREKKTIRESHYTSALSRIEKMLNEKVTPSFFIETSEMAAHALMADRQSACDSAVSSWNDDLDNFVAIARESNSFNRIMCRYFGYFVDALEAQASFGCTPAEIKKMSNEVSEFSELVAEGFSCGNSYYDLVVNSRAPVTRPAEYSSIRRRLEAVRSDANRKLEAIAQEEARKKAEAEAEARRKAAEEERIRKQKAAEFLQIPLLLKRIGSLAGKDGYCAVSSICEGFEDIVTVSQVEKALDKVWHQGIVRKATTSEGSLYAIAWSDDAWREARDKENARLAEEHRSMDEANARDYIRKTRERISDCEGIEESLQKYIAKLKNDESAATARLVEGKASLAALKDAVTAKTEEVKALDTELSNQGFFAFGKKRELRDAIAQAKASADKLMQEQMEAGKRVASLQEELESIKRNLSKQNDQLIETRKILAELKQSLDSGPAPLPIDVKGRIHAMMKLFACPVSALWCMENVAGVEDEGTALSALEEMTVSRDVVKYTNDTYALAAPRAPKRRSEPKKVDAPKRDTPQRFVSEARLANERLAKKVYDLMPRSSKGVTTRDVVDLVPEILTTQKAAAVLRVGIELGYFTKTVEETHAGAIAHFFRVPRK